MIDFEVTDNTGFADMRATVVPKVTEAIRHNAAKVQSEASGHAPRSDRKARSGGATDAGGRTHYADTIDTQHNGPFESEVGTDAPFGYRLEQGFHGLDSLGRFYQQSGQPHFGPAAQLAQNSLVADIEILLDTEPGRFADRLR